ncbi:MAG: type I secretion C-terminal target domain-containing protein [Alphaproteobacteria bacterium]|nr:type I secretion C-terminal target domain-containing protein [Alphaproteobacteria bacterium]
MPKDVNVIGSTAANKVFDLPLSLQAGQVNTLSFSQDSISSMQLTPQGELEISFRDGSRLVIENFQELANSSQSCGRDTLIQLSDNTIIYPEELRGQLAQGSVMFETSENGLVALAEPKAGQVVEANIVAGHEYQFGFDLSDVSAAQAGQNLILSFANGGVLILNNFFAAASTELPPVLTLADGAVVDSSALLTSCKLVEIPTIAETVVAEAPVLSDIREGAPDIEPAAGDEMSPASAPAQQLANVDLAAGDDFSNIEPAAGDAGAQPVSSSRGYGFNSSIDGAGFGGEAPIGPIGVTALNYSAPVIPTLPYVSGRSGSTFTAPVDYKPVLGVSSADVDETVLGSATGNIPADFGRDGPGHLTFNDDFVFGGSVGSDLLSCDIPVIVTHTDDTYTGVANGAVVFTLVIDSATGDYIFTQFAPLAHADATNPNDVITLSFGVTGTDKDGDASGTTITINVYDDGPVAVDDVASVGSAPLNVSGNVLVNDDAGTDGNGHVTAVTFNGTVYTIPVGGSVSVVGAYGALVIDSSGGYTYTSSNTALGTDQFTYTMADCDADTDQAVLSIEVTDLDVVPTVEPVTSTIDETGLGVSNSVSGSVVADFGVDGPGTYALNTGFTPSGSLFGGALTSNGVVVDVALVGGQYVGTAAGVPVFTLVIDPSSGAYTFTQLGQLDHADGSNPNDVISLGFGVTVTDSDGDAVSTIITINVRDDAPVAERDFSTVPDNVLTVSGNVTDNDNVGEDQPGYVVSDVSFNGIHVGVPATGAVTVHGVHGVLEIDHTGAYTYTSYNVSTGQDQFTYKILDQDGDATTAVLTVIIADIDTRPCVKGESLSVDETIVDDAGSQTVSGTLTVDFRADGPGTVNPVAGSFTAGGSLKGGALTSNGVAVAVSLAGDVYTGKAGSVTVFTLTINDNGTYTYQQLGQLDHADASNPDDIITLNFGFVATDTDGDTAQGTISVKVHDDAPVAVDDVATLAHAPGSVSGNVTTNDDVGEDEPGYVVKEISFGATHVGVPATGTVTIAGAHGSLTISHTGAYTYTGTSVGNDQFVYKIVDQDGDAATATLKIVVADIDTQPTVIDDCQNIDETDLGPIVVNGTVSPDFRADGPGTVTAIGTSSVSVSGNAKGGVLASSGVPVVTTLVGDTYIGKAGSVTVFTLKVNVDGTYKFTLFDNLDHSIVTNHDETLYITFGVRATDTDGDFVEGTIKIGIDDDGPIAVDDYASVPANQNSVSGDVDLNDDIGSDFTTNGVAFVKYGSTTYTVPVGGTVSINGAYGTLVIGSNGEYTYTVKPETVGGQEVFTYTLCDTDQDIDTANLVIDVAPRYLPPEPPSVDVCDACVYEDGHVQLQVSTHANGGNGNEIITLSISGFTAGWIVNTVSSGGVYNAATGVWSITLAAGASYNGGPVIYPPANSDADLKNLVVKSVVYDPDSMQSSSAQAAIDVIVDAVADKPNLDAHDVFAVGATAVALQIDVSLKDTDGSEVIKEIRIEGMPNQFTLNHGFYDSMTGRWVLTEDQLDNLQVLAPHGYEGQFSMLVTAVSQEKFLSGDEYTTSNNLAYSTDIVTVSLYGNSGNVAGSSSVVVNVTSVVSSTSTNEVIVNGETSTSSSSISSSSSVVVGSETSSSESAVVHEPIVIHDFSVAEGDILDLSSLIEVQDGMTIAIQDFVFSRTENGNTIISVDADGAGTGHAIQDVVVLQGVADVHLEDIVRVTTTDQNQSGFSSV